MRLLIVTQAVDTQDPVLSFFHLWIREFAANFERIHVVCLKEGEHALPRNVSIHSLGKEEIVSSFKLRAARRIQYTLRFWQYAWSLRREYDAVFVHMNQEYVLLGGFLWKLLGKPIYLWRNHYMGSMLTDFAALWCKHVFCTSKFSYTAKYKKTVIMPVGVDTNVFKPLNVPRTASSILSLGRIAPSKHIDMLIDALALLKEKRMQPRVAIYGHALAKDASYHNDLKRRATTLGLMNVRFEPGIPNTETPKIYSAHDIFVNCSESGMYDKTIFEAAASGCLVLASSKDFQALAGDRFGFSSVSDLAERIRVFLSLSNEEREAARRELSAVIEKHSLKALGMRLAEAIR